MGQIYLVRHGQASFGDADYDRLSATGIEQARLLGQWFAGCGQRFGGAVTGSLRRHRQTAEACLFALPEPQRPAAAWHTDAGFDEYDHDEIFRRGDPAFADPAAARAAFERSANPKRAFQEAFAAAMERWMASTHNGGYRESWPAFRARCVEALKRVADGAGASQSVIVFTSGGPIAAICQELLGLSDRRAAELNWSLVNSAVTKLLYQPGRISLSYLNSFPHLEQTGQAQTITYR
jgi:broad specificity phosphatase PhoE